MLKDISSVLNEVLKSVMKCMNAVKDNAKCERFIKQFCQDKNADHILQNEVK